MECSLLTHTLSRPLQNHCHFEAQGIWSNQPLTMAGANIPKCPNCGHDRRELQSLCRGYLQHSGSWVCSDPLPWHPAAPQPSHPWGCCHVCNHKFTPLTLQSQPPLPPACSIKELHWNCPSSEWRNTFQHTGWVLFPSLSFPVYPAWISCAPLVSFFLFSPPSFSSPWHKAKLFYLQQPLPKSYQNGMLRFITTGSNIRSLITNFEWPGIPDFYWTYLKSLS